MNIQHRIAAYLILDIDAYQFLTIPNPIDIVDEFCATHGLKRMGGIIIEGSVNRDYFQIKAPIEGWKETATMQEPSKEDALREELDNIMESLLGIKERL